MKVKGAESLNPEQRDEDDADKVLEEVHHHGSDEALPPCIDETKDQAHAPDSDHSGRSLVAVPK